MHWNGWRGLRASRNSIWAAGHVAVIAAVIAAGLTACTTSSGPDLKKEFPGAPRAGAAAPSAAPVAAPAGAGSERDAAVPASGTEVNVAGVRTGRVALVNATARYVIVTYPLGELPGRDSVLFVFRNGLKVAELKVTDFSRDTNAAADIVAGDCRVGDEVREP